MKKFLFIILISVLFLGIFWSRNNYQEKRVEKILLDDNNYSVEVNINEKNNGTVTLSIDSGRKMIIYVCTNNELSSYDYINLDLCEDCLSRCIYTVAIDDKKHEQNKEYKHAKQLKKELSEWFEEIDISENELTIFMEKQLKNS